MWYRVHRSAAGIGLAAILWGLAAGASAQPADEAEQSYQAFKGQYQEARTADDLRAALGLVRRAHELEPERYKYAFGIGAVHERLAEFTACEEWFGKAFGLAADEERREKADARRQYCQNELDKRAIQARGAAVRISFATKRAGVRRGSEGVMGEADLGALPSAYPGKLQQGNAAVVAALRDKLPERMSVVTHDRFVIAAPGSVARARGHGQRIAEYEDQIRRRFFPEMAEMPVIMILGDDPIALRRIAESLYPGAAVPYAPFFGIYHRGDRLILATVLGGYGTLLHELMHALVGDDDPNVPLWLEEGLATLYERSGWSAERLIAHPNWRLNLITPDKALAEDAFAGIGEGDEVPGEQLALVRLLFSFLDDQDRLAALHATVKGQGPRTTLEEALETVELDREAWRVFVERSFREYALEKSKISGGGLSTPVEIRYVQRALNAVMGAGLKPDGAWGPNTERALREFQRRFGLDVDGVVGSNTITALRREYGTRSLE